jgi:transcription-repair coupling factor (superfamily II helicase)
MTTASSFSLSLRAVIREALGRAGLRDDAARLTGLSPAARALYVAATATRGLTVLVVPTDRDVESGTADARFFFAALTGASPAEAERVVLPFPSHEVDPYRGLSLHFDVASARARALHALANGRAALVIASAEALLPRVSTPERLLRASVELAPGMDIEPSALAALLADAGYTREDPVDEHGEFSVRGGVVDVFPAGEAQPIRLEFIGDTIESIRRYDPASQRSVETLDHASVVPLREVFEAEDDEDRLDRQADLLDFTRRGARARFVVAEADLVFEQAAKYDEQVRSSHRDAVARGQAALEPGELIASWDRLAEVLGRATRLDELAVAGADGPAARHVPCQPATEYRGRVADWVAAIRQARERGETVVFVVGSTGRAERSIELLREYDLVAQTVDRAESLAGASVLVAIGRISKGFRLPEARLQLFAETDVFDEERQAQDRRRAAAARAFLSDFRDLKVGDLVVHVDHGIGRFVGLKRIELGASAQEFMELRYAGDDKLFVPVERLDLVQKYVGGTRPSVDRLGGASWEKAKTRVKKAMRDMADELLKLYAARRAMPGFAFGADTHWQEEFEASFEYDLTPDQANAITDIKRDMESPTPMDRLLCGDVGYGKTEVAMRAAFKAVMDGKQVAVLAPTTVLAFQHLKTLRTRFAAFPVSIDMVSRFRTKAEQKAVLADLAAGRLDILVGTHRLLSKDVQFRDLGLLVVDEEQRFGVVHKERLKQIRRKVDVLTMSATPIPRTLNMSLVGIRDMSIIETPPRDRLAIQTQVVKFDQRVIASAIRHEIERGGQVYVVHNRVESIHSMAALLSRLVPEARIGIGHGQLSEDALEKVMVDFVTGGHDVLLATTIIENGLDIPNANTMIINRADRYGLSQLYQLRGRVGRSDRRAYAYLLIPPEESLSSVARKRLAAIKEFSDLGSGFRVAALDLEIRGAGNLLGGEQSGHIEAIGFEMYAKLLDETIRELKGEDLEDEVRTAVNLAVDVRIDADYIADMTQRLGIYRRIASARSEDELTAVLDEIRDRYGPLPPSMLNLAGHASLRLLAERLRVESLDREGPIVVIKFRPDASIDPARLVRLLERRPDVQLAPPAILRLDLRPPIVAPRPSRGASTGPRGSARPAVAARTSWWTVRAGAGEVTPGFSREAILRQAPDDPRAPGGLFERLGGLLAELSDSA